MDDDKEAKFYKNSTSIDPLNLNNEYIRLPARLATWNARYAIALDEYLRADAEFDTVEASLAIEIRETLESVGKKATEAAITERIRTHSRYIQARDNRIAAEVEKVRLNGIISSIHAKKEMLISLGAHIRKEMDGDIRLREQMADRRKQDNE